MKKKWRKIIGMTALATSLCMNGCGSSEDVIPLSDDTAIETELEPTEQIEAVTNIANATASTITSTATEMDEFSEEREAFERLVSNYEQIYTDEYHALTHFTIEWNSKLEFYEIKGTDDENSYSINMPSYDLINLLIHESNCKDLTISYDRASELLASLKEQTSITSLVLNDCAMPSLKGIENLPNLEELVINNCTNITSLSELATLTNLKTIMINGTRISDISVLANLNNLEYLNMRCNEITNPSVLNNLEKLSTVHLEYNNITDIEELAGLVEKGILTSEQASSVVETSENHQLLFSTTGYEEEAYAIIVTYMDSKHEYFVDIRNENMETVAYMLRPDTYNLYGITNNLPHCQGAKFVNFPNDNMMGDPAYPEQYTSLIIDHCDFDTINFLDDYDGLTYLEINGCPYLTEITTWGDYFYNLDNLKTLIVKGTNISNLDVFSRTTSLEGVELQGNSISDFSFLLGLDNLKAAIIRIDCYPADISSLTKLRDSGINLKVIGVVLPEPEQHKAYGKTPE